MPFPGALCRGRTCATEGPCLELPAPVGLEPLFEVWEANGCGLPAAEVLPLLRAPGEAAEERQGGQREKEICQVPIGQREIGNQIFTAARQDFLLPRAFGHQ